MRHRLELAAALVLGACTPVVDVYRLHPSPRGLAARPAEQVKLYDELPANSVAVYGFDAFNGNTGDLHAAVQVKAASLGCDGIVISERQPPSRSEGIAATGQITERRELVAGHIAALCVVIAK